MSDCLFCKIVKGDIPSDKVYEDENILAFNDISPKAPTHILVIPKKHYAHVHEVPEDKEILMGQLMTAVANIVQDKNLISGGYRLVINSGPDAGQEVPHLHVHILSGRSMQWPPG